MKNKEYYIKLTKDIVISVIFLGSLTFTAVYFLDKKMSNSNEVIIDGDSSYYLSKEELSIPFTLNEIDNSLKDLIISTNIEFVQDNKNQLSIKTIDPNKKGTFILKASKDLSGYIWGVSVKIKDSTKFELISNYKDDENYTSCVFQDKYVRINQRIDGIVTELAVISHRQNIYNRNVTFAMTSNVGVIKCYINSNNVLGVNGDITNGKFGMLFSDDSILSINAIIADSVDNKPSLLADLLKFNQVDMAVDNPTTTPPLISTTTPIVDEQSIIVKPKPLLLIDNDQKITYSTSNIPVSNWKISKGVLSTSTEKFILGSNGVPSTLVYLEGAFSWDNYKVETTIDWGPGTDFSLIARYDNPNDYISCVFSNYGKTVGVYGYRDGELVRRLHTIELPVSNYPVWLDNNFGMEVSGSTISCSVNGETVIKGQIPRGLSEGTFGMKIEDRGKSQSSVTLKKLVIISL